MTALTRYERLEGSGLWRPDAGAQRRDVGIRLGKSSLVIADSRNGTVLGHWALTSFRRDNPGRMPARYLPSDDGGGESLESDDPLLTEALDAILASLSPPARSRRLRWVLAGVAAVATLGALLWLPALLVQRTAAVVPEAMRVHVGREALDGLIRPGTGVRLCAEPSGRQALSGLRARVLGPNWRVLPLDGAPGFDTAQLPGRVMLLSRDLIERLDSPEALAGWMLAEAQAAEAEDPLRPALRHAGVRAMLSLLTTGTLPEGAMAGYARSRLEVRSPWPDPAAMAARLAEAGVVSGPYATSLPPAARALAAALADTRRPDPPLLTDGQWLTLQAVCHG